MNTSRKEKKKRKRSLLPLATACVSYWFFDQAPYESNAVDLWPTNIIISTCLSIFCDTKKCLLCDFNANKYLLQKTVEIYSTVLHTKEFYAYINKVNCTHHYRYCRNEAFNFYRLWSIGSYKITYKWLKLEVCTYCSKTFMWPQFYWI